MQKAELLLPTHEQKLINEEWLQEEYDELQKKYKQSQQEFEQMLQRTHQLSSTLELLTDLNQHKLPKDVLYQAAHSSISLFESDGATLLIHHHDGIYPLMVEGNKSHIVSKYIIERVEDVMSDERAKLLSLPPHLGGKARHVLVSPFGASWDMVHLHNTKAEDENEDIFRVRSRALLVLWCLDKPYGLWQASLLETLSRGVKGLLQGLERLQNERKERKEIEKLLNQVRKETQLLLKESKVINKQAKNIRRDARILRKSK